MTDQLSSLSRKTIADLELKVKNLKAEIYDAREQLKESRSAKRSGGCVQCTESAVDYEKLNKKYRSLKFLNSSSQEKLEALEKQLTEQEANLSKIVLENDNLRTKLESVQSQLAEVMSEHAELKHHHESRHSISLEQYNLLAQGKAAAEEALLKSERSLEEAVADNVALIVTSEEIRDNTKTINSANTTRQQERDNLLEKVSSLEAQLTAQAAEHQAKLEADAATYEEKEKELAGLKRTLLDVANEKEELKKELAQVRDKPRDPPGAVTAIASSPSTSTTTAVAAAFNTVSTTVNTVTDTNAAPAVVEPSDDFSVLSDNTHPTSARATTASLPHSAEHQDSAVEDASKKCLLISNVPRDTISQNIRVMAQKYGMVVHFQPMWEGSYLVQFAEVHEAHNALRNLSDRVVDGTKIRCGQAPRAVCAGRTVDRAFDPDPVPVPSGTVMNFESSAAHDMEKHLCCVYVLHHAPAARRLSADDTQHELKRYGHLHYFTMIKDSDVYMAEFVDKISADKALENFPVRLRGYKISCVSDPNQLPSSTAPIPADAQELEEQEHSTDRRCEAKSRVILHDSMLEANRAKKTICTYCKRQGQNNPYTHTIDTCGVYRRSGASADNAAGARLNMGYERKRARSESPDRPARKFATTRRTSTGGGENGSSGGSGRARDVKAEESSVTSGAGNKDSSGSSARGGQKSAFEQVSGRVR